MNNFLRRYWSNKTVLITGASSGLGWAMVEALARYHVHFGLMSRSTAKMQALAEKLSNSGSQFSIYTCDVRNRIEVFAAVQRFRQEAGRIDVAWVNSGVGEDSSHDCWSWENFEAMIETNLKGAIYTTQACIEVMLTQGHGAIAGIGSAAAMKGLPGRGVYGLTKVSLEYFFLSKMAELPQIRFTVIHPGFVDTPINQGNSKRFWLMQPDRAARIMIKAVARRRRVMVYPFRMRLLFVLVRHLPNALYSRLAAKAVNLSRPGKPGPARI